MRLDGLPLPSSVTQTRSVAAIVKDGIPPLGLLFVLPVHRQNSLGQILRNHLQQLLQSLSLCRLVRLWMLNNQCHRHLLQCHQIVVQTRKARAKVKVKPPALNVLHDCLTIQSPCTTDIMAHWMQKYQWSQTQIQLLPNGDFTVEDTLPAG